MGFPLPISIENIFLFLTLYKSPKKCRHSHHEQMCRYHAGLVCRQAGGRLGIPGTEPASCLSFTLPSRWLPTAQVQCAKPPWGQAGSALVPPSSSPSPHSLPRAPHLKSPSSSVFEPPALLSPGFWSLQEKGNGPKPALSALCIFLGAGKGPPLSPMPSSLLPYTGTLSGSRPCLTDPCGDR